MNIKEIEINELRELCRKYTPTGFVIGTANQSGGTNKISLISIEIMGYAGFASKVCVDFSAQGGLIGLQGKNGYGKSSLWKAIEQCLCLDPEDFNKNKQSYQFKLTLKYKGKDGEHTVVCTPTEKILDGKPLYSPIIESVRLDLSLADLTSRVTNDSKEYNSKVLNLTELNNYFDLVASRQAELDNEIAIMNRRLTDYEAAEAKYKSDNEIYLSRLQSAKEDAETFDTRLKEWEALSQKIVKENCDANATYQEQLDAYNSQLATVKGNYAKYRAEHSANIQTLKAKLAALEGTDGGSEKDLNAKAKELKTSIVALLSEQQKILSGLEQARLADLDAHLSTVFTEHERAIIAADYVNGKKRLETKLKKAKALQVGECPTCTTELTTEMISDLVAKYQTAVKEMEEDSKKQASLKGKEAREKTKYIWARDTELAKVKRLIEIYRDATVSKDTDFRKKYPSNLDIEVVDNLLEIYGQIYNIKSLRTKNAGEIKAVQASIKLAESDLISEDAYIRKNAVHSQPQAPLLQTVPERPKQIAVSSLIEPKKPVAPEGFDAKSDKLSELNLCREVGKRKGEVISRITKEYFDKLKPRIEAVAKKLHLDLTVEIGKNMAIGYTYNGVKMTSFSSGEQTAVNIAVALAYSYLESDILFIDEKLDTLDKDNFTVVQDILKSAISELGIRAFVIISHRELNNMDGRITL